MSAPTRSPDERLLTPRLLTIISCGLAYFLSLGMLLPVVPLYVSGPLGGGDLAVGVVVGAFAVGAVGVRPLAGRIGDSRGRRVLVVTGAVLVAVSTLAYVGSDLVAVLFAVRLVGGVGEGAFFVGAGTMVTDLAPVARRGEAISYWSIAVYSGLAFGPWLGEWLLDGDNWNRVWMVSAGLSLTAALVGMRTRETLERAASEPARSVAPSPLPERPPLIHRASLAPGLVLFLGIIGLAGFTAFVPLYVTDIGMSDSKGVFLLYGCTVLAVRLFGARLPDRLGSRRSGGLATSLAASGLVVVALLPSATGLYVGTLVFSLGMSLLYPAMLTLALDGVPERERSAAVGTVSSFFDLSQGLGAAVLGLAVALSGYRGAFLTAATLSAAGFVFLRASSGTPTGGGSTVLSEQRADPHPDAPRPEPGPP